mgnify:FL=1
MPAVYAHYLFGKKVYKALPEAEKKMVRQGKDAFLIGLHGPDLLFYYRPFGKNRINQQGTRMHRELAAGFFEKGKEEYEKDHDPVLRAYLYGFLCHFILDSAWPPYISCYMEEHGLGHLEIETDFERYLFEKSGHDPLCYVPTHHLISRRHTREQISRMFENVTPKQIDVCIKMFRRIIAFFICASPVKRRILRTVSRVTGQDKELGGLIMDGIVHPGCGESNDFLEERMEASVETAVQEIVNYSRVLEGKGLLSIRLYRDYEETI